MKRGRKQDDSLPPSRSREIQRAFRQRRIDYIHGLEQRVKLLESEIDEVLARLGEPQRYTISDTMTRTVARKRSKNKSKQNSTQLIDSTQTPVVLGQSSPVSLALYKKVTNATASPETGQNLGHDIPTKTKPSLNHVARDFPNSQSSPEETTSERFPLTIKVNDWDNFDCLNQPHSPHQRKSKALLQNWDFNCETPVERSPHSKFPDSSCWSQQPVCLTPTTSYHQTENCQLGTFMAMDSGVVSPSGLPHIPTSSFASQPQLKVDGPANSPSTLTPNSHPRFAHVPSLTRYGPYNPNQPFNATSHSFRSHQTQFSTRFSSACSVSYLQSHRDSSSTICNYSYDNSVDALPSRNILSTESRTPDSSSSTQTALTTSRIDGSQSQKLDFIYSTSSPLLTSPTQIESPVSQECLREFVEPVEEPQARLRANDSSLSPSSTLSEPKEFDNSSDDSHCKMTKSYPFQRKPELLSTFDSGDQSAYVTFYNQDNQEEWPYQPMKFGLLGR